MQRKSTYILILLFVFAIFLSAEVEQKQKKEIWTVRNNTWLLLKNRPLKGDPEVKLKQVWKGTKVKPVCSYASNFKVILPTEEYGYINYNDLNETYWVENEDSIKFYYGNKWGYGDYEILPPGTRAYRLATIQNGGIYKVRLEDGRTGTVIRHYMKSPYWDILPEVDQKYRRSYLLKELNEKLTDKARNYVVDYIGPASAFIYTNQAKTKSELYYRYVFGIKNNKRHLGIKINFENNKAKSIESLGKDRKSIAETLPLAGLVRSIGFNWIAYPQRNYYDDDDGESWWTRFKNKNFIFKIIGFIVWLITIFLFFSIPQFISWPFRRLIIAIKPLSNGIVKFINFLLLTFFMYLFFLVLTLYLIYDQFIIMAIFTLIPWFIFIRWNNSNVNYNRCPNCHTMWSASDQGSTHTGTEKSKKWKQRDVYKGTSQSGTTKVKHYERHWDEEISTTENYLDHRRCQNCGYDWDVERSETTTKTIKH